MNGAARTKLRSVLFGTAALLTVSGCTGARDAQPAISAQAPVAVAGSADHPPVVAFSPAVAQQFRRPLGRMFAARPVLTQAEYTARNSLAGGSPKPEADPEAIASFIADRTVLTYSPQHGPQVEYIGRGGETYLWYPGNDVILRGSLAVLWEDASAEIDDPQEGRYRGRIKLSYLCFRYAANTYNPVTNHRGGGFECAPHARQRATMKETRKGDVFGLAGRNEAPFPLGRESVTLAALQKRAGPSKR